VFGPQRKDWAITEQRLVRKTEKSVNIIFQVFQLQQNFIFSDREEEKNPFSSESWHWSFFDIFYHGVPADRKEKNGGEENINLKRLKIEPGNEKNSNTK